MTMHNRYQRVPSSGVRVLSSQSRVYPKTVRRFHFSQRGCMWRWIEERGLRDEPHPDNALYALQLAVSVSVGCVQSKIQTGQHLLPYRVRSTVHPVNQLDERTSQQSSVTSHDYRRVGCSQDHSRVQTSQERSGDELSDGPHVGAPL